MTLDPSTDYDHTEPAVVDHHDMTSARALTPDELLAKPLDHFRTVIDLAAESSRKTTVNRAARLVEDVQDLASRVRSERRIADLEDQIRTERGKLTGTGKDADDDGLDDA